MLPGSLMMHGILLARKQHDGEGIALNQILTRGQKLWHVIHSSDGISYKCVGSSDGCMHEMYTACQEGQFEL